MRITTNAEPLPVEDDQPLIRGNKGDAVRDMQSQLLRAGYTLPRYGADGDFGRETAAAVRRFQKAKGLPETGAFDLASFTALENTPSPSPDYDALFKDGVLRAVVAIGYDEVGSHHAEQTKLREELAFRGYTPVTDHQRAQFGLDAEGEYVTHELPRGPVIVELITADTDHAKERFANAMRRDEFVLYGGHGRYGSGPDFDDIHSPAGNFVIGAPFEAGHVTLGANDLEAARMTSAYQLLFFDGCNTFHYFDDLRSKTPGKTTRNLDVVGSSTELYWNVTAANLLTMLDGVTDQQNLEQLEASLDAVNRAGPTDQADYFRADGFEDN